MDALGLHNPVFVSYAICALLMVLKVMGQGWMTVYRMMRADAGLVNTEDLRKTLLNPDPRPEQLELDDYVDRSRRMHRNDLENIPTFWIAGLVFLLVGPPAWLAHGLFFGFVLARLGHAWAYATARDHEVRAAFYTVGSLIVIVMAFYGLGALLLGAGPA